jgi:hypothetical protein
MNRFWLYQIAIVALSPLPLVYPNAAIAAPTPEQNFLEAEIPEEVLRTQIILDVRSPIDGTPMSPVEYAEFQARQEALYQPPATVSEEVRGVVRALKIRRFIKRVLPFIPIK